MTRHPAVTAAAIASVQVESGRRGDSSLAQLGLARPSTARVREFVSQVRGFLRGETVTVDGARQPDRVNHRPRGVTGTR